MTSLLDHDFRSALKWSVGAHAVLGLLLIFKGLFFPSEPLRIEDAIRVDLIALPDKNRSLPTPELSDATPNVAPVLPEAVSTPPPAPKQIATKDKPSPKTKKVDLAAKKKQTQAQSLKRLKALERLEAQARKEAAARALAQLKAQQLKGNQLSTGNALSGLTRLDQNEYLNSVEARIKQNWQPPKFLARSRLKLRVLVRISNTGTILSKNVLESSGNGVFDQSALLAIESADPLPPPPESLHLILENEGLEIELDPSANDNA